MSRRSVLVPIVTALALMTAPAIAGAVEAGKGPYAPLRFENYRWIILSYFDGQSLINSHASSSIAFVNGRIQGAGSCGPCRDFDLPKHRAQIGSM